MGPAISCKLAAFSRVCRRDCTYRSGRESIVNGALVMGDDG